MAKDKNKLEEEEYRIGNPMARRRHMLRALGILAAAGGGAFYGSVGYKALNRKVPVINKLGLSSSMLLGAAIGGTVATGLNMLNGSGYSYNTYKVPHDGKQVIIAFSGANGGNWLKHNKDVRALDAQFGRGNYALFAKDDVDLALAYLKSLDKDTPVRIVGHSLGGPAAYRLAQLAAEHGISVDRLDTQDPVGRLFGSTMNEGKPVTTKSWNNYVPTTTALTQKSDIVAVVGGRIGEADGARNHMIEGPMSSHVNIRYAMGGKNSRRVPLPEDMIKQKQEEDK